MTENLKFIIGVYSTSLGNTDGTSLKQSRENAIKILDKYVITRDLCEIAPQDLIEVIKFEVPRTKIIKNMETSFVPDITVVQRQELTDMSKGLINFYVSLEVQACKLKDCRKFYFLNGKEYEADKVITFTNLDELI